MKRNNYWYNKSLKPVREKILTVDLDKSTGSGSYSEWKFYFPNEDFNLCDPLGQKIKAIEEYFHKNGFQENIHINLLQNDEALNTKWSEFFNDIVNSPEQTLNILNMVLNATFKKPEEKLKQFQFNSIQISGYKPVQNINEILPDQVGKFTSIRGIVIRVDEVEIQVNWMCFECASCHSQQAVRQFNGLYRKPEKCTKSKNSLCNNRSDFIPLRKSPYTKFIEMQKICVQDMPSDGFGPNNNMQKTLEIVLFGNLTDLIGPGDDINVSGILKFYPADENAAKQFDLEMYLEANSIRENKKNIDFLPNDTITTTTDVINEISSNPNPFKLLVHSLCPQIYGNEMVKAGLILGLLGGVSSEHLKRGDIHVLLVGEPGLGKSELLQACRRIAPKGIFVSGQNCSKVGLTVKVRRDNSDRGSLEAGALVTAHGGNCFIDELDKMSLQHNALLEVMEQQKVSIAKAGVLCNIPAKTSILAAANPIGGSYNKAKTAAENIKMNAALLSRFDLVFILLDTVKDDIHVSKHLLNLHNKTAKSGTIRDYFAPCETEGNSNFDPENLEQQLKGRSGGQTNLISRENFKKFIAFAKKHCQPVLCAEAKQAILDFYIHLREIRTSLDHTPITPRTLEALMRLSQARARVDLSHQVTLEHVRDIISLFKFSMVDFFSTNDTPTNFARNKTGAVLSKGKQFKIFCQKLQERVQITGEKRFEEREIIDLGKSVLGPDENNIKNIIDSLNIKGQLLNKGHGIWSVEF